MEQKSLTLKQQTYRHNMRWNDCARASDWTKRNSKWELRARLSFKYPEDEYKYKLKNTALQMESLKHDSSVTLIRKELLKNDLERESKKLKRAEERLED